MLKLITLVLGLAIGFGGGVYWSARHPDQAAKLSKDEEARFLQAQMAVTQQAKDKLDQLMAKYKNGSVGSPIPGSSGFLGGGTTAGAQLAADPDAQALRSHQEEQLSELKKRLESIASK